MNTNDPKISIDAQAWSVFTNAASKYLSSTTLNNIFSVANSSPLFVQEFNYVFDTEGVHINLQPSSNGNISAAFDPGKYVVNISIDTTTPDLDGQSIGNVVATLSHEQGHAIDDLSIKNSYFYPGENVIDALGDELLSESRATVYNDEVAQQINSGSSSMIGGTPVYIPVLGLDGAGARHGGDRRDLHWTPSHHQFFALAARASDGGELA